MSVKEEKVPVVINYGGMDFVDGKAKIDTDDSLNIEASFGGEQELLYEGKDGTKIIALPYLQVFGFNPKDLAQTLNPVEKAYRDFVDQQVHGGNHFFVGLEEIVNTEFEVVSLGNYNIIFRSKVIIKSI